MKEYLFILQFIDGSSVFYYVVKNSRNWDFYNLEDDNINGIEFSIIKIKKIVGVVNELFENNKNINHVQIYRSIAEYLNQDNQEEKLCQEQQLFITKKPKLTK